jgi:hypothetical protein
MITYRNRRLTSAKPLSKHENNKSRYDRIGKYSKNRRDGEDS